MSDVLALIFPAGELKQAVTSITLVNNTAKTQDVTVPAGVMWKVLNIKAINQDDVNRNITIVKYKEAAKTNFIKNLAYKANVAAGGGSLQWPNTQSGNDFPSAWHEEIAVTGNTYAITWAAGGASTGSVDADGLVIEYLELHM